MEEIEGDMKSIHLMNTGALSSMKRSNDTTTVRDEKTSTEAEESLSTLSVLDIGRRSKNNLQGILKKNNFSAKSNLLGSGGKSVSFNSVCCIAYFERDIVDVPGPMILFDPETYWDWAAVGERNNFSAHRLAMQCMQLYDLNLHQVQRLLRCYRQFIESKVAVEDFHDNLIYPARSVRHLWQLHLGDRFEYEQFCILYCGRIIRFNPCNYYGETFDVATEEKIKYTKQILAKMFGNNVDKKIWKFTRTNKARLTNSKNTVALDKKDHESIPRGINNQSNMRHGKENSNPSDYDPGCKKNQAIITEASGLKSD
mmetsp:Transcript_15875/g.23410  ORF Transcript_15875/g.23410 Transcript_15875/m.23410 type:complete len:312 (-) Transcript_15875:2421-3356(-)